MFLKSSWNKSKDTWFSTSITLPACSDWQFQSSGCVRRTSLNNMSPTLGIALISCKALYHSSPNSWVTDAESSWLSENSFWQVSIIAFKISVTSNALPFTTVAPLARLFFHSLIMTYFHLVVYVNVECCFGWFVEIVVRKWCDFYWHLVLNKLKANTDHQINTLYYFSSFGMYSPSITRK